MSKRRILVISAGAIPHPDSGASVVLFYHYVAGLLRAGFQVFHILILDKTRDEKAISKYREQIRKVGSITIELAWCPSLVKRRFGGFKMDHELMVEPLQRARDFQPDIFFGLDFLSYWAAESLVVPFRMVWLGDLNFQTRWHHALCMAREQPLKIMRIPSAWKHAFYWRNTYSQILKSADKVIVSSGSSVGQMRALGIESSYQPYPWPHSPPRSNLHKRNHLSGKPTFLFCGGLNALGSKSALLFILKKLYPRLYRLWGDNGFRIIIAGRGNPSAWTIDEMARRKEVDFRGFVEDLDTLMEECHGLIVPIDIPVGNRCRIVTALANGWLIIAHKFTQAGNPDLRDGENCYLVEDAAGFVNRMQMAFEEPDVAIQIRERAKVCYKENFLPEQSVARLLEVFPSH